jgi:predicted O-linked N-acetylglucosamine transferase (SPINDLY family)
MNRFPDKPSSPAQQARLAEAQSYLRQAVAYQREGRLGEAEELCRRALKLQPDSFDALHMLGIAAAAGGDPAQAVKLIGKALTINPRSASAHYNRGLAFDRLAQPQAAVDSYNKAIQLKPDHAAAYNNRGLALNILGQYEAAAASFDAAIRIDPTYVDAHNNLAYVLSDLGRDTEAIARFAEAARLQPDYRFLTGAWLHTKMRICDWTGVREGIAHIDARIARGETAAAPWYVLSLIDDPAIQRKAAEIWTHAEYPPDAGLGPIPKRAARDKICLAYISMDFRDHAVAALTAQLFESHNRDRFEVIALSTGPNTRDPMRQRLEKAFDQFIDVHNKTDHEIAALARRMNIDIAVDLAGHTADARTGIMALRAAPLQIGYLGYAGTTGADYIDYVMADGIVAPPGAEAHFTEKLIRLLCFQPNDTTRAIDAFPATRADAGLPEEGVVFCCFNDGYKITPDTFDTWMRILKRVDGSVLWLRQGNAALVANLQREAETRGIDPARLIFAPRVAAAAQHLARHRLADLFLDTLPFNAHTTASDALWAGLPVLTCAGASYAGRVASSLLHAAGLPELITTTPNDYEALAVELGTQPARRKELRAKLAAHLPHTCLFDTARTTRHIESAYARVWERYQSGLAPDHITISDGE